MISNQRLINKADLALTELVSNGGDLPEAKAKEFFEILIKKGVMMPMIRVTTMKASTETIPKIRFAGRILRAGQSGMALSEADRSKPETSEVSLSAKLFKAEVQLNDEVLEDNVEGALLNAHVTALVAERISSDVDDILINSDTSNAALAPELRLIDGLLKAATTNTVAAGGTVLTRDVLKQTLKAMPVEFQTEALKYLTSKNALTEYCDGLGDRMTPLGDQHAQDQLEARYQSYGIKGIPQWPENLGGGTDETAVILTDPKNIVLGFWRTIKIAMDRNARSGSDILIASLRMDFDYEHEPAVVKTTGIKVSA